MTRSQCQLMNSCIAYWQLHHFLDNTTSHCRIILRIHIRLTVNQCLVKVNHLRFRTVQTNRIFMTTHIQEVKRRLHNDMNLDSGRCISRQGKTISQAGTTNSFSIRSQCYRTACTTIVGIDTPLGISRSLRTEVMFSLHSHIATRG